MQEEKKQRRVNFWSRFLCVGGLGGLLTYMMIELSKTKLLPLHEKVLSLIQEGQVRELGTGITENIILLVSILVLLAGLVIQEGNKATALKVFCLSVTAMFNMVGVIVTISKGEISLLYIVIVWVSAMYIVWILIDIFKSLYKWITVKDSENQVNVAKLTFIWTIIVFVLTRV